MDNEIYGLCQVSPILPDIQFFNTILALRLELWSLMPDYESIE